MTAYDGSAFGATISVCYRSTCDVISALFRADLTP